MKESKKPNRNGWYRKITAFFTKTYINLTSLSSWLTGKNAFCPNFHTEWSNSCLQDLANQTLLPLALPNYTANNFHCAWARWAKQATQARQLFTSFCPRGLRRTGMAFFRLSDVWLSFPQNYYQLNKVPLVQPRIGIMWSFSKNNYQLPCCNLESCSQNYHQ